MSQQMFVAACTTLTKVAGAPAKNDKMKILTEGDSPYLRSLLLWTYNRFKTYRVLNLDYPETYSSVSPDVMPELERLLDELAAHKLGTNEAKSRIKKLLSSCTKEHAQIIANVIMRDIRCGIDETTINKVFDCLIPVFGVQSAQHLEDWSKVSFPIIMEEKMDGIRLVGAYDGDKTRFYSKGGFEIEGFDAFDVEINKLMPGAKFVLDGEFKAFKFNPKDAVCQKHRDGNWEFEYAKAISRRKVIDPKEIKEFFKYHIWDVIDYTYFHTQGRDGRSLTTEQRKTELFALFTRHGLSFNNIEQHPNQIVHSQAEVMAYMAELKTKRKEGLMLKPLKALYTFKKNMNVIKLKHFVEGDFRILGAYEGEKGKKYEGMLGGLVIGTDDGKIKTNMGSGFTDAERCELWVEYLAGRLVDRIVEIQLKDLTADNSIQLPTLLRFRDDKNSTDTFEELRGKLNGVKE